MVRSMVRRAVYDSAVGGYAKVVKRMWNMLPGRNFVVYALIAVAVISIILTLMTEQETTVDLP